MRHRCSANLQAASDARRHLEDARLMPDEFMTGKMDLAEPESA